MFKRLKITLRRFKPIFCRHEVDKFHYGCLVFKDGIAGKIGTAYCKKCGKIIKQDFFTLTQIYLPEEKLHD